jgi:predicted GIY-YIG superfamily endonuclease
MPRIPIDYANTIIYKIVCNDLDLKFYYVGYTTDFVRRKQLHKSNCNNESSKGYNTKKYKMIREQGGWDCWTMLQIEEYPCKNRREAASRERFQYENLNSTMNTQVPGRSYKEWVDENKIQVAIRHKEYYIEHKDKLLENIIKTTKIKIMKLVSARAVKQLN